MSSRNGMARADVDTGLLFDRKVVALARRYRDETQTCVAVTLYLSAVLASWREDRPVSVVAAAPAWMAIDVDPYVVELRAVGLVDRSGRIPKRTLDAWMSSVRQASERGRAAADARWRPPHSGRIASAMPGQPTGHPAGRARARERSAPRSADPRSLKEIVGDFADVVKPKEDAS